MNSGAMSRPAIGVVALARSTFDVPYAQEMASKAFAVLDLLDAEILGSRELLFDADATRAAVSDLKNRQLDLLLVLQVTFTDATMTVALARDIDAPMALWAFPEPRSGGRLRLNSLCGINLAGHALGKAERAYSYLYCSPDSPDAAAALQEILAGGGPASRPAGINGGTVGPDAVASAARVRSALARTRLGVIGRHPEGFDTCAYDPFRLAELTGVTVQRIALSDLFATADAVDATMLGEIRQRAEADLRNLGEMEAQPLEKSLRVYAALRGIAKERGLAGMAVRCWPEFFTDYGCAACGAMAMMNEDGTPCACEADVYGNVTTVMLRELAEEPVFMADLVDLDRADDSGVFWHCGLAPLSMADPEEPAQATIHSNRRKPLLNEFALKPGRITVARLSQSKNRTRLVIGGAEMLRAPKSFGGTCGVVRFDRPAGEVLDRVMAECLEHHYAFAYGDFRSELRALADLLSIPVVELS